MMVLVIADHTFSHTLLNKAYNSFWERISIPVLMVIMGFNLFKSYQKRELDMGRNLTVKELYSKNYFRRKMERFIFPYLVLYFFDLIITNVFFLVKSPRYSYPFYESQIYQYFGYTSFWGPGMWFIPVILSSILIFPLLYYCFKRYPKTTFLFSFIIEISMQWLQHVLYSETWWYTIFFFYTNILFLLSAIGMGMWIALNSKIFSIHNIIIWILGIISLLYLIGVNFIPDFKETFHLDWISGDYNFLTIPYSALLVLIVINLVPSQIKGSENKIWKNKIGKVVQEVSNSTYHILLAQILWFSIWYHYKLNLYNSFNSAPLNYLWFYPLNLSIGFGFGYIWYRLDKYWIPKSKEVPICALLYYILTVASIYFYITWFFRQFYAFWKFPIPETFYYI